MLHGLTHNNKHTFLELCMQVEIFLGLSRPRGVLQDLKYIPNLISGNFDLTYTKFNSQFPLSSSPIVDKGNQESA